MASLLPGGRGRNFSAEILRCVVGLPVRTVSGVQLELFPISSADEWIVTHLRGGTAVHEAMDRSLHAGMVFIDIGANIGLFSILAEKKYGARVIAVEPSERERGRLERNMSLNGVSFTVLPCAFGEADGAAKLSLEPMGSHTMNRIRPIPNSIDHADVPLRRFDSALRDIDPNSIALVKIDVEGYEMAVLKGMTSMIDRMVNAVFVVEVTPSWLADMGSSVHELYEFFEARGWRGTKGRGHGFQWDEIFVAQRRGDS